MKKIYLLSLLCLFQYVASAVVVTINAVGAAGSYKTGYTQATTARTDGNMVVAAATSTTPSRGYAVFDLTGVVPNGATVSSVVLRFNYSTSTAGTGVVCRLYGYPGDLSTVTTPATLYANCAAGASFYNTNWGASTGGTQVSFTLLAAANTFVQTNENSIISIGFVTNSGGNIYTITGEGGTAATQPQLTITYTCTGVSGVSATATPNPICDGSLLSLTGAGTGTSSYRWNGPGGYTSTLMSPNLTATATSAGIYTLTAYNAGGCGTTVNTSAVVVNPLPAAISGPASGCTGQSYTLSDATGTGTWTSTNTSVGTISAGGVLSLTSPGTTTVDYTLATGCLSSMTFTSYLTPQPITGAASFCEGSTTTLSDVDPSGTWTTSDASVAAIDPSTGLTTGVHEGSATITYTLPGTCYATYPEVINPQPDVITGPMIVCLGYTGTLADSIAGGVWTSGTPAVASIDPALGIITGHEVGNTEITYTNSCGMVTISEQVVAAPTPIVGRDTVCQGGITSLADVFLNGIWTSSDTTKATVDSTSGLVSGHHLPPGPGMVPVTITYTIPAGCSVSATVWILPPPPPIIGNMRVCPGTSTTLADGSIGGGTWVSEQSYVATVGLSNGSVTGVTADTAHIRFTDVHGCTTRTTVTVNPLPLAITGGKTICATSIDTFYDATPGGVWSCNPASIASIGAATGIMNTHTGGTVTITYTLPATTCAISTSTHVTQLPAPVVTYDFATITFFTDTTYLTYQWYDSLQGLIPGAVFYKTAALYNGNYYVVVTDGTGCSGASVPVHFNTSEVGVKNQYLIPEVKVYPNPATGIIYIESVVNTRVIITSMDGRMEMEIKNATQIDISRLADGIHLLAVYDDNGQRLTIQKLVKE